MTEYPPDQFIRAVFHRATLRGAITHFLLSGCLDSVRISLNYESMRAADVRLPLSHVNGGKQRE